LRVVVELKLSWPGYNGAIWVKPPESKSLLGNKAGAEVLGGIEDELPELDEAMKGTKGSGVDTKTWPL
jgi:hypothetical protein